MTAIRVVIADDQKLIQESLKIVLDLEEDIEIVGLANNGEEAVQLCERLQPDLILMDIHMPLLDGVGATQQIKQQYPHIKIVILTSFKEVNYVIAALSLGAEGYLLKAIPPQQLAAGIRVVHTGETLISQEMASAMMKNLTGGQAVPTTDPNKSTTTNEHSSTLSSNSSLNRNNNSSSSVPLHLLEQAYQDYGISEREMDVLLLLAQGLRNVDIAEKLYLSEGTVKNYVSSLYSKLQVKGRREVYRKAKENGLLDK